MMVGHLCVKYEHIYKTFIVSSLQLDAAGFSMDHCITIQHTSMNAKYGQIIEMRWK